MLPCFPDKNVVSERSWKVWKCLAHDYCHDFGRNDFQKSEIGSAFCQTMSDQTAWVQNGSNMSWRTEVTQRFLHISVHLGISGRYWTDRSKRWGSIFACWNVSSQRGLSGINMSSRKTKLTSSQRKSLVLPEPNFQECSWLTRQHGSFSWKLTGLRVMYEILWLPSPSNRYRALCE